MLSQETVGGDVGDDAQAVTPVKVMTAKAIVDHVVRIGSGPLHAGCFLRSRPRALERPVAGFGKPELAIEVVCIGGVE